MLRHIRHLTLAAGALALAGCGDTATAPRTESPRSLSPFAIAYDNSAAPQTMDFVLTASGGTFNVLGKYTLTIPSGAVCDPDYANYGSVSWDSACVGLFPWKSVTVHAVLSTSGALGVDFSPPLRFSPYTEVTLSTAYWAQLLVPNAAYYSAHRSALNFLPIYYSSTLGGSLVSDFATDHSLITHVNLTTGVVSRRIKHFSGYIVSTGLACNPTPDNPECIQVDNPPI